MFKLRVLLPEMSDKYILNRCYSNYPRYACTAPSDATSWSCNSKAWKFIGCYSHRSVEQDALKRVSDSTWTVIRIQRKNCVSNWRQDDNDTICTLILFSSCAGAKIWKKYQQLFVIIVIVNTFCVCPCDILPFHCTKSTTAKLFVTRYFLLSDQTCSNVQSSEHKKASQEVNVIIWKKVAQTL